jgi:group I intron endonuclease
MKKNNYVVYRHTAPNGKMYVGITSQNVNGRWQNGKGYSHNQHFSNAIKKYGWDNFKHEILLDGLTSEQATWAEMFFIEYWDLTDNTKGYNKTTGGIMNYDVSEETKKKRSAIMRGRHVGGGVKGVLAGDKNPNYGKHLSDETKRKMSEAKRGEKAYWYGKHLSEKTKYKISVTKGKPVAQIDKHSNEIIATFVSSKDAGRQTGICYSAISRCCRHCQHYLTAGGYKWEFVENIE